jgi:hypothetical protein
MYAAITFRPEIAHSVNQLPILRKPWEATLEGHQENSQVSCIHANTRTMLFWKKHQPRYNSGFL